MYGLASKWTSFVATQKKAENISGKNVDVDSTTEDGDEDFEIIQDGYSRTENEDDAPREINKSMYASSGAVKAVSLMLSGCSLS